MEKAPVELRDKDALEAALLFLFKNWILLLAVPLAAGLVAFVITLGAPRTSTVSVHIPAPPFPIQAFDDLWRDPNSPYRGPVAPDGSVLVNRSGIAGDQTREFVNAALAAAQQVATKTAADAMARQTSLSNLEARLATEIDSAGNDTLAQQATALAVLMQSNDLATVRSNAFRKWSQEVSELRVAASSSNGSNRIVPFAAFSGFTFALIVAIARWLWSRWRSGRLSA